MANPRLRVHLPAKVGLGNGFLAIDRLGGIAQGCPRILSLEKRHRKVVELRLGGLHALLGLHAPERLSRGEAFVGPSTRRVVIGVRLTSTRTSQSVCPAPLENTCGSRPGWHLSQNFRYNFGLPPGGGAIYATPLG